MSRVVESVALKEWSLALRALRDGDQILLARKGGIVEETGAFEVVSRNFLLYPTFYHQEPQILKPSFQGWLGQEEVIRESNVEIDLYAQLTDVIPVSDPEVLESLSDYHIWTTEYLKDRFYWKPNLPLTLLLLKVYRLDVSCRLKGLPEYGGCRSWLELKDPVSVESKSAVLDDLEFERARSGILDAVSSVAG